MKRLFCITCQAVTQHIIFSEQVQCQKCGKGTKKANLSKVNKKKKEQGI